MSEQRETLLSIKIPEQSEINENAIIQKLKSLIIRSEKRTTAKPVGNKDKSTYQFLTPDEIDKGLSNFEIMDYTGQFNILPAGYEMTPEVMELLKQLVRANPEALYMKQKTEMDKAGDIPYSIEI